MCKNHRISVSEVVVLHKLKELVITQSVHQKMRPTKEVLKFIKYNNYFQNMSVRQTSINFQILDNMYI